MPYADPEVRFVLEFPFQAIGWIVGKPEVILGSRLAWLSDSQFFYSVTIGS
jgi:hypothetical protein